MGFRITRVLADDYHVMSELVAVMRKLHDREGARLAITLTECLDDGALPFLGVECDHFLSLRRLQIPPEQPAPG